MNERLHHLLDSNYYLYNCNLQRDIENNIGEIEIPEFTMEHINNIDKEYMHSAHGPAVGKDHAYKLNYIEFHEQDGCSDEEIVKKMSDSFELNELYIEHIDNMVKQNTDGITNISQQLSSTANQLVGRDPNSTEPIPQATGLD